MSSEQKEDFYIVYSYPEITGSSKELQYIEGEVIKTGITDIIVDGNFNTVYGVDIIVKIGNAEFYTCSSLVDKFNNKTMSMELPNLNLSYPRVMMVSDEPITKENPGEKRVVWAYNPRLYCAYRCYESSIQSLEELDRKYKIKSDGEDGARSGSLMGFLVAKDYEEPKITELTLQDIADKFNLDVSSIRIKD